MKILNKLHIIRYTEKLVFCINVYYNLSEIGCILKSNKKLLIVKKMADRKRKRNENICFKDSSPNLGMDYLRFKFDVFDVLFSPLPQGFYGSAGFPHSAKINM